MTAAPVPVPPIPPEPTGPAAAPPHILVLGTGGTIAGRGAPAGDGLGYQAAQIGVDALLHAVPALDAGLHGLGLRCEQLAQVDSKDMDDALWRALALRCRKALAAPQVAAIVITHGTDTLEETAWFLHCVLPPGRPVVLTCAMRPPTALDADGPANLRDALLLAAHPAMRERALRDAQAHVLTLTAGRMHAAAHVRKAHPYRVDAFTSAAHGPLGWMEGGQVRWAWPLPDLPDLPGPQAVPACTPDAAAPRPASAPPVSGHDPHWRTMALPPAPRWPWVEILTAHAGARPDAVDALTAAGVRGIILAATGNGTLPAAWAPALERARHAGVVLWRCTRCEDGPIVEEPQPAATATGGDGPAPGASATSPAADDTLPPIAAIALSAPKARVSLMLALMLARPTAPLHSPSTTPAVPAVSDLSA